MRDGGGGAAGAAGALPGEGEWGKGDKGGRVLVEEKQGGFEKREKMILGRGDVCSKVGHVKKRGFFSTHSTLKSNRNENP